MPERTPLLIVAVLALGSCSSSGEHSDATARTTAPSTTVDGFELQRFRSCQYAEFWAFDDDDSIAVAVFAEPAGAGTIALPDPAGRVTVEIRHGTHLSEEPVCQGTGITATERYRLDSTFEPEDYTGELEIGPPTCPTDGRVVLEHLTDADGTPFESPMVLRPSTALGCFPD